MITSAQNTKIKWVKSLQASSRTRRQEGLWVVEGVRLAEEALASGWTPKLVLHTPEPGERIQAAIEGFAARQVAIEMVSEAVMRSASDTETPQGILVVLEQQSLALPDNLDFVFIPDGVRDPGNLGTMLRTAAAAGVQAVFLPPGAVDPFLPKVVRSGMGAHFRLPIYSLDWQEIASRLATMPVYLASAGEGLPYTQADWRSPLALIVGGEAQGAGEQAWALSPIAVQIPMPGQMESLNAAMAAGILIFEVLRQRNSYPLR
jgi:TrmH family RNA methyltransferase